MNPGPNDQVVEKEKEKKYKVWGWHVLLSSRTLVTTTLRASKAEKQLASIAIIFGAWARHDPMVNGLFDVGERGKWKFEKQIQIAVASQCGKSSVFLANVSIGHPFSGTVALEKILSLNLARLRLQPEGEALGALGSSKFS